MHIIFILLFCLPTTLHAHFYTLSCNPQGDKGRLIIRDTRYNNITADVGEEGTFNPMTFKEGLHSCYFLPQGSKPAENVFILINRDLPAGFMIVSHLKRDHDPEKAVWLNLVEIDPQVTLVYKDFEHKAVAPRQESSAIYVAPGNFSLEIKKPNRSIATIFVNIEGEYFKVHHQRGSEITLSLTLEDEEEIIQQPQPASESALSQSFLGSLSNSVSSWLGHSTRRELAIEDQKARHERIRTLLQSDTLFGVVGWDIGHKAPQHIKCGDNFVKLTFGFTETEALTFALQERESATGHHITFKTRLIARQANARARFYIKGENQEVTEFLSPYFDETRLDFKPSRDFQDQEIWVQLEEGKRYKLYFSNHPDTNQEVILEIKDFKVE